MGPLLLADPEDHTNPAARMDRSVRRLLSGRMDRCPLSDPEDHTVLVGHTIPEDHTVPLVRTDHLPDRAVRMDLEVHTVQHYGL